MFGNLHTVKHWTAVSVYLISTVFCILVLLERAAGQSLLHGAEAAALTVEEVWIHAGGKSGRLPEDCEVLVPASDLLAIMRIKTASAVANLRESGSIKESLELFSRAGGVLEGYDNETPDILGALTGPGKASDDIALLQGLYNAYGNYSNRCGEFIWIADKSVPAGLLPAQTGTIHRLFLLPGCSLWQAPSFSARRMEQVQGPHMLFSYAERRSESVLFHEVGPTPLPEQASYVAFARAGDSVPWNSYNKRIQFSGEKSSVRINVFEHQDGAWARVGTYEFNSKVYYPVTDVANGGRMIRVRVLNPDNAAWIEQYRDMPLARKIR